MTSWHDLERDVPDLADRARRIFASTTNAVLATLRKDGSPRLSGIDPTFFDGHLWLGSMPDSRKGADLRRDPRLALHCIPWESRRPKGDDPGEGDAKLAGRAVLVTDDAEFTRVAAAIAAGMDPPPPPGPYDLFWVDVLELVVVTVEGDELVLDRWAASGGRHRVART